MPDEEPPLKRESAGHYRTRDGRFAVEQNSGRWLVLDTEQTDELGLPLVRGPFASLDESRDAIRTARTGPAPRSTLTKRAKGTAARASRKPGAAADAGPESESDAAAEPEPEPEPEPPPQPSLTIRRLEPGDGRVLRRLTEGADAFEAGRKAGRSAAKEPRAALDTIPARRFLAQPDVHLLVAFEQDEPVGFVLAYELLRRDGDPINLFVHEVRVRADRRREETGRRLLEALWALSRDRGIGSAFVIAATDDRDALAFYRATGGKRSRRQMAVIRFSTAPE
jgi:ribosomal protein S18 acetylase RimI-like enzyme